MDKKAIAALEDLIGTMAADLAESEERASELAACETAVTEVLNDHEQQKIVAQITNDWLTAVPDGTLSVCIMGAAMQMMMKCCRQIGDERGDDKQGKTDVAIIFLTACTGIMEATLKGKAKQIKIEDLIG